MLNSRTETIINLIDGNSFHSTFVSASLLSEFIGLDLLSQMEVRSK